MELTPKEKADELIKKFLNVEDTQSRGGGNLMFEQEAIDCAIIAVDLLLDDDMYGMDENNFDKRIEYYQDVKQELLKRKQI